MRIAWTGPVADHRLGQLPAVGGLLLSSLLDRGVEVQLYYMDDGSPRPDFFDHPNLKVVSQRVFWRWDRWYSRNLMAAHITRAGARAAALARLGLKLRRDHALRPYDCIFQFSTTELFTVGLRRRALPPIVVHPCTSAAAELRWHKAERRDLHPSEARAFHYTARAFLSLRTRLQSCELQKPTLVVGPSEMFLDELQQDYDLEPSRLRVLRHPVDLARFRPSGKSRRPEDKIVLLFPSRLSARKGVELVVGLSHRLADLAGTVRLEIAGGPSLWSDYTAHLKDLHPEVAVYLGEIDASEMPRIYERADAVLVPSHFEPGSLVTGEALACGLPVVASDRVGPTEVLDESCCRVFRAGDVKAFERCVRDLITNLRSAKREFLSQKAREEAAQFAPATIGGELVGILEEATVVRRMSVNGSPGVPGEPFG